jgi:hypothetical protein
MINYDRLVRKNARCCKSYPRTVTKVKRNFLLRWWSPQLYAPPHSSLQRSIPTHLARWIISSLAHCNHAKRGRLPGCCSCYFPEYRSMLGELHAACFHVAACIVCMNDSGTSGTRRIRSQRQNFVDAVVTVSYNTTLHIPTRRRSTSRAVERTKSWASPENITRC